MLHLQNYTLITILIPITPSDHFIIIAYWNCWARLHLIFTTIRSTTAWFTGRAQPCNYGLFLKIYRRIQFDIKIYRGQAYPAINTSTPSINRRRNALNANPKYLPISVIGLSRMIKKDATHVLPYFTPRCVIISTHYMIWTFLICLITTSVHDQNFRFHNIPTAWMPKKKCNKTGIKKNLLHSLTKLLKNLIRYKATTPTTNFLWIVSYYYTEWSNETDVMLDALIFQKKNTNKSISTLIRKDFWNVDQIALPIYKTNFS